MAMDRVLAHLSLAQQQRYNRNGERTEPCGARTTETGSTIARVLFDCVSPLSLGCNLSLTQVLSAYMYIDCLHRSHCRGHVGLGGRAAVWEACDGWMCRCVPVLAVQGTGVYRSIVRRAPIAACLSCFTFKARPSCVPVSCTAKSMMGGCCTSPV